MADMGGAAPRALPTGRRAWSTGWRGATLAAALGVLSALALPPVCLVPVLLVAVPGLLWLIGEQSGWRGAAWAGFCFGFGQHVVGLYWITEAILIEAARFWWFVPIAVPSLSAVLALFIAVPCAVCRLAPAGWRRVAVLAGGWVLLDMARQFVGTGFPWNPLGSVWAIGGTAGNVMLQPAALVGVHGLTLATLLLASTPALGRRAVMAGALVLALWAAFGAARLAMNSPEAPNLAVVIAQGDVEQGHKWDRAFALATFGKYLDLTRRGVEQARAAFPGLKILVVWPETASPFLLDTDAAARAAMIEAAGSDAVILAGSIRFDAARKPLNSLEAITSGAPPVASYDKWHLVPFGEYAPSWFLFPLQVVPGGGFAFGSGPRTLHIPGVPPVGPLICYEAIFSHQVIDQWDRPDFMVNVTNDAWFGNSTGPRQHLAAARIRAVEEAMPLVRAANTGISAIVDGNGREAGRLGLGVAGVMVRPLAVRPDGAPLAARLGLAGPAALAAMLVLAGFIRPTRPARTSDR